MIEARAAATSVKLDANALNSPETFKKFEQVQSQLTSALSRLLVVVEKYPELKANQNFQNLQAQLEGTENRITVARKRYIESVATYNTAVRSFPQNLTAKFLLGLEVRPTFSADEAAQKPPAVKFKRQARRAAQLGPTTEHQGRCAMKHSFIAVILLASSLSCSRPRRCGSRRAPLRGRVNDYAGVRARIKRAL